MERHRVLLRIALAERGCGASGLRGPPGRSPHPSGPLSIFSVRLKPNLHLLRRSGKGIRSLRWPSGAPVYPALSGAAAGLVAGAMSVAALALHLPAVSILAALCCMEELSCYALWS